MGDKRAKMSLITQELEMGGISAIAKQKKAFGVALKKLKSHVLRVKKQRCLSPTLPTPVGVSLIAKSTMLLPGL